MNPGAGGIDPATREKLCPGWRPFIDDRHATYLSRKNLKRGIKRTAPIFRIGVGYAFVGGPICDRINCKTTLLAVPHHSGG